MKNKTVWMMVGVPGSGKTWCAKNKMTHKPDWRYVSRDEIRFNLVSANEEYFSKEKEVFKQFVNAINRAFEEENVFNVIADATHLNEASRNKLRRALPSDYNIIPVVVTCDYSTIVTRNASREGRACVPEYILHRMYNQFEDPESDIYSYDKIIRINNNKGGI